MRLLRMRDKPHVIHIYCAEEMKLVASLEKADSTLALKTQTWLSCTRQRNKFGSHAQQRDLIHAKEPDISLVHKIMHMLPVRASHHVSPIHSGKVKRAPFTSPSCK